MNMHMDGMKINIIVADDHEVVRTGIVKMVSHDPELVIVAEACSGKEAIELVEKHNPDVLLLDIQMPNINGIQALKKIRNMNECPYVIMLTAYEDSHHIDQAVDAGADGYLLKNISASELIRSIKTIMNGERIYSKPIVEYINKQERSHLKRRVEQIVITKREQEILDLVASGKRSAEIAEILFISTRTVETHRYNVMQKLGVNNTAALVRYAVTVYN